MNSTLCLQREGLSSTADVIFYFFYVKCNFYKIIIKNHPVWFPWISFSKPWMTLRWIAAATFLGAAVRTVFRFVYKHLRKDVLATIKLWSQFLKKAAISSWWKRFFLLLGAVSMLSWLLIIAFYPGYRWGKQSLPLCLNPSLNCDVPEFCWKRWDDAQWELSNWQAVSKSVMFGASYPPCLNFLCLKEGFCDKQQCPSETKKSASKHFLTLISVPITVLGILQHILNVVNHECTMSLSKALFQKLTWW